MRAIVEDTDCANRPITAHAVSSAAVCIAARASVTTVEYGYDATDGDIGSDEIYPNHLRADFSRLRGEAAIEPKRRPVYCHTKEMKSHLDNTKMVLDIGIKLACNGKRDGPDDIGWDIADGRAESRYGARMDNCGRKLGWLASGAAADIIGLIRDPRKEDIVCHER
ncbi:hypothetical protein K432DRAFT_470272 [Lepidopterella palustris CBS 459.81]|uniref:Amidohydrolase-related domain-containing protein n=1 Tax=Lepidopterella palustris CBS 459.81 TaxID=1314670 RepID=A0A8E2DZ32_9PEZI|nr:hypothetical protein K432DRAFT_470272 [Lepidopterella palustris CBS 459.81]